MQLWSFARVELGLTSEEFWDLTPRQFDALSRRKQRITEDMEFLFGQLTAYVINFSRWPPKQPVKPADFMPSQMRKQKPRRFKRRSRQKIADEVRAVFAPYLQR